MGGKKTKNTAVRAYRKIARLSQPQLASSAELSTKTVDNAEKGLSVSEDTAIALVGAFNKVAREVADAINLDISSAGAKRNIFEVRDFFEPVPDRDETYTSRDGDSSGSGRESTVRQVFTRALRRISSAA